MTMSLALLLLLALSSYFPAFADDVNIDCGSSSEYKDGVGRKWVGDGGYTKSGKPMTVSNSLSNNRVMNSLQVFSTGNKNCYSIPSASKEQVLVRASFYYGNYDKKSSPPSFALLLGSDPWDTVVTSSNSTVRYEAIYVVKGGKVQVCVAQTSENNVPFMSALEVRGLSYDMYRYYDPTSVLFLKDRSFFSDNTSSILDINGRIWESLEVPSGMTMETSDATTIVVTSIEDNPPQQVLRNAATLTKSSDVIHLTPTNLPTTSVPVYVNMYFSEVTSTTHQRLFNIYVDDHLLSDEPIAPQYGHVVEFSIYDITANSSTSFYLIPTSDSTLPPLINAFEVFVVSAKKKKKSKLPVILGTTIPALALFWAVVGFLAIRHQKKKSAAAGGHKGNNMQMAVNHTGEAVVNEDGESTAIHENNTHNVA